MDREKLFRYLDQRYCSKRELLSRIPLGVQPEQLWQELLSHRRSKSTSLPLYSCNGMPYWYVTTEKMVSASEKIIEALMDYEAENAASADIPQVSNLEEVFYTSFVEGAQITMQEAMDFLTSDQPPRTIEEQMIANNRVAGNYASGNLYRSVEPALLQELAFLLTDGMDIGGQEYRSSAEVDFTSPEGEAFEFPGPHVVPDCVTELCTFLSDPKVHPLIKAGVAQAYLFIVRPFPEGNERLGRILSSMILLRAGYGFFSEVSLSALIARKSYAYYEAMNSILRIENGNDITYFLEFFLELLSRAVDERRLRIRQREEQSRQAEQELARTVLTPPTVPVQALEAQETAPAEYVLVPQEEAGMQLESQCTPELQYQEKQLLDGFSPMSELTTGENEAQPVDEAMCLARVRDTLYDLAASEGALMKGAAQVLLRLLEDGTKTFTVEELRTALNLDHRQSTNMITHLKEKGVIESCEERSNRLMLYRFATGIPPLMPQDYSPEVITRVKELINSRSPKDKRIGDVISSCMAKGIITLSDYDGLGDRDKMGTDMLLPLRMGLLTKLGTCIYRINRVVADGPPAISSGQKELLTKLYQKFQGETFTAEDAFAVLTISKSSVNATLHQFVLLRLVGCTGNWSFTYRVLVNPKENPELFSKRLEPESPPPDSHFTKPLNEDEPQDQAEPVDAEQQIVPDNGKNSGTYNMGYAEEIYDLLGKLESSANSNKDRRLASAIRQSLNKAMLLESNYEKWGYTHNMWLYDTTLARQLGLVRRLAPDAYVINKRLHPELQPQQKKTVSAIYETFGDQEFSSEMFIATLNYSPSYTYASLHKLTLLRILGQRSTEEGNQYQLLVNPEDHPECFEPAA